MEENMKEEKKVSMVTLFFSMLTISAFTFGGGFVIIGMMRKKFCDELHWVTDDEVLDMTAIAQSAPGALAVNSSVIFGYRIAGLKGAIVSAVATVIPPIVIISIVAMVYSSFASNVIIKTALQVMIDLIRKNGDRIDLKRLGSEMGCEVVEISALKGEGCIAAAELAAEMAQRNRSRELPHVFTGSVEHAIAHIEESIQGIMPAANLRWYAIKIFERDEKVMAEFHLDDSMKAHLEQHIQDCEKEMDDDAESIITNQRYAYINQVVSLAVKKKNAGKLSASDKIDRIVTNRWLALPIFALIMKLDSF